MEVSAHNLLIFAHILLFAYWLGADLGVFYGAKAMARPGLSFSERQRIMEVVVLVDTAPRTALVLMLPVGFQLSTAWGFNIPLPVLTAVWMAAIAWLALVWLVHLRAGTGGGEVLRKVDLLIRYLVLVTMLGLGVYLLTRDATSVPGWLATKVLLFSAIIATGLRLRMIAAERVPVLQDLKQEINVPESEAALDRVRRKGARTALFIWGLVALMALIGSTKPF